MDVSLFCLILATFVLLYLTVMDIRFFLLPDKGNLALAFLGLVYQSMHVDWSDTMSITSMAGYILTGSICGAGIFLFTRWVSLKWKGVEGIGWGDVKFSAAAGIWLGPAGVGFMIGGAAFLLLAVGGLIILFTKRPLKDFYLPFGAAAAPAMIAILWLYHQGVITL